MSLPLQQYDHQLLFDGYTMSREEESWESMFQELVVYNEMNGDCNVVQIGNNTKLGQWVATQRELFRIGNLEYDRVKKLTELDFVWTLQEVSKNPPERTQPTFVNNESLDATLLAASEYIRAQGHGWIPVSTPGNPKLGPWANNVRYKKRKGILSVSRQLALESIGFVWEWEPPNQREPSTTFFDGGFESMVQTTAEYIRARGHGWVPCDTPEFPKLGRWAAKQRTCKKQGKLSTPRQVALESVGFVWEAPESTNVGAKNDAKFEEMVHVTLEYIKVQGHGFVPIQTPEFPKLGNWAQKQRTWKRQGRLSAPRQLALDNIGFIWEAPPSNSCNDAKFVEMLQAASEYIRARGHGWVPDRTPEFPKLGGWAQRQRRQKRQGKLSTPRQVALESVGFVWEAPESIRVGINRDDAKFEEMVHVTAQYIKMQGHGFVPIHTPEFPKLGRWAGIQRAQKRQGKLCTSREMALENIGFVWDGQRLNRTHNEIFEAMLQLAAEYIRVQGHGWVPFHTPEFPKLGRWALSQRNRKRKGKLSTSRQLALESIDFVWEMGPKIDDEKFEAMLQAIKVQGNRL